MENLTCRYFRRLHRLLSFIFRRHIVFLSPDFDDTTVELLLEAATRLLWQSVVVSRSRFRPAQQAVCFVRVSTCIRNSYELFVFEQFSLALYYSHCLAVLSTFPKCSPVFRAFLYLVIGKLVMVFFRLAASDIAYARYFSNFMPATMLPCW